jgi:uncharacterized Zn finger protein (UPF0148 family)
MSFELEERSTKCSQCGAIKTYYYDGDYYCKECGKIKGLVKLILNQSKEIKALWDLFTRISKKIGGI